VLEEPRGRALTTHMNLRMRIDSLQTLLHVSGDDEGASYLKVDEKLNHVLATDERDRQGGPRA
jgi:hypothetical protein